MLNRFIIKMMLLVVLYCIISCNKREFLEKSPSSKLLIPRNLDDFQALLDNHDVMGETPVMGELSADNYYLLTSFWQNLKSEEREAYIWQKDIFQQKDRVFDWEKPYQQVFYANIVLNGLPLKNETVAESFRWNHLKGSALFIRAYAFYNLTQVFAPAFDSAISPSENDFGIPMPLEPGIKPELKREKVTTTYNRIISDLAEAIHLLPDTLPLMHRNRPSKPAAYALMARVYLSMRAYDKASLYADSSLDLYSTLIDYNGVSTTRNIPFDKLNEETLYQSSLLTSTNILKALVVPSCIVDSTLFQSYDSNDLRRSIFYSINSGLPNLKGGYSGTIFMFSGLATDELYLIRAECQARSGNYFESMNTLNTLLEKRYKTGTFVPLTATSKEDALDIILLERRKEIPFRGVRWSDLRRLNKEGRNITLMRKLDTVYRLPPNHSNYVLPVPPVVTNLNTNITQYPRK